ncbi:hypothetical protein ARMGADRAFT_531069 [Armillaria gallica]|uniref:Uncharacterized protein n=1 Tax=Armillaria gallica TaxID=47427 RepID=A0A2H3CU11_ARMGA|nr:hypothetical protein ARMGADRAFT_531069 [Armillaria gallica]
MASVTAPISPKSFDIREFLIFPPLNHQYTSLRDKLINVDCQCALSGTYRAVIPGQFRVARTSATNSAVVVNLLFSLLCRPIPNISSIPSNHDVVTLVNHWCSKIRLQLDRFLSWGCWGQSRENVRPRLLRKNEVHAQDTMVKAPGVLPGDLELVRLNPESDGNL